MSKQLQLRKGTTAEHTTFTGALAEVTVDTDKHVVVVHDNSTPGGFPLVKEADIGVTVQGYNTNTALVTDVTFENLNTNGDVGTGADQVAAGDHLHSGVYEPVDATILRDADIGVTVQAYDVNTVSTDTVQVFTAPQRSAFVIDNDGSFDCSGGQNFKCTPTLAIEITFTNIPDGQSGTVILDNSAGVVCTAHVNTKITGVNTLSNISTAGVYILGYITDGTYSYITSSEVVQ